MIVLDYQKNYHRQIIHACVAALKRGKVVAYPTDTVYGLAVDATNTKAIKALYVLKGRDFNKPVHIIPPSLSYAKTIGRWNKTAGLLANKFWPGALTLVTGLKSQSVKWRILSANSGYMGFRMPNNRLALDLAKNLKRPITTTSANVSGAEDCHSAEEVIKQFSQKKHKPDIVIDFGTLPKRQPSTVVKIQGEKIEILRQGPISRKQLEKVLGFRY